MSIPLLGPTIPPFSQYFQEQSSIAVAPTYTHISLSGPMPSIRPTMSESEMVLEDRKPDASEKHRLRHFVARAYLDGIYVLFEQERRDDVEVPKTAHVRSVKQREDAVRYRKEQAVKAARAASKAQLAAEEAERRRLRGDSDASSFSLRRMSSSLNRLCSRIRSGQKGLDRVEEQPSRAPSSANLQGLAAAGGAQEVEPGDDHHGAHNTPASSPAPAVAAVAVAGPSRSPSSGSPKAIGTRAITHGRNDSGTQESCQQPGADPGVDLDEGRMGLVVREKVSMASSRKAQRLSGRGRGSRGRRWMRIGSR